tara:strand:- start:70 stop:534 length:465 start_codon:yes stop_codon:yes gene_type:complete
MVKRSPRTLVAILECLIGVPVTIELRQGHLWKGEIEEVDAMLNVILLNASYTQAQRVQDNSIASSSTNLQRVALLPEVSNIAMAFVCGKHIRFIRFPSDMDLEQTIVAHHEKLERLQNRFKRGKRKAAPAPVGGERIIIPSAKRRKPGNIGTQR